MARKVITLKGSPYVDEDGVAGEAITPGKLVAGVSTIVNHATANGPGRSYALERDELGKDIDVDYATTDVVKVGTFIPGSRVYTWIASGQNITKDDFMGSAGNGTVKAWASGPYIGRALETTGAVTVLTRLRMEIY